MVKMAVFDLLKSAKIDFTENVGVQIGWEWVQKSSKMGTISIQMGQNRFKWIQLGTLHGNNMQKWMFLRL